MATSAKCTGTTPSFNAHDAKISATAARTQRDNICQRPLRRSVFAPAVRRETFRKVKPRIFLVKLAAMAILIAIFDLGIVSTNVFVKQSCGGLIALPPFAWAAGSIMAKRSWFNKLLQLLTFGLIALLLLSLAILAPTIACQFAIGALFAHGTQLAHQALHKTGTGKVAYDTPIGFVLCGLTFMSFVYFLWNHLRHHRHNGTEHDRESFAYSYILIESTSRTQRLVGAVLHLSMAVHYAVAANRISLALCGRLQRKLLHDHNDMSASVARRIQREYQYQGTILLLGLLVSFALHTTLLLDLWLIPVLLGWGPAQSLIESTEHWHCDIPDSNVFRNTRSLKAGAFACWYTNFNNCHVGHHHDMSVPIDMLPEYEAVLTAAEEFRHVEESYPLFYYQFLHHIWKGAPGLRAS